MLPHPRRVRGPLGWIAHVCGAVASEYNADEEHSKSSYSSYIDPVGALYALVRPSKRLAQATHDMLSDPFLSKLLGLAEVEASSSSEHEQDLISRDSAVGSGSKTEPLFTASDRKTEMVASKDGLYESIRHKQSTAERAEQAKGTAEQERLQAELLLDSHPLLSPTIGDWTNIKLKGGILVTWGERERMADDIEAWVDSVYRNEVSGKDAPPAQDGESQPTETRKSDQEEDDDLAIETAVERGPGGVHAWPFVSMYLAGSEAERERGLDLLADFIARSSTDMAIIKCQAGEEQAGNVADPPHAAPDSPISETGSAGSMPSDVDLHGMVDDEDYRHYYQDSRSSIDIVEAVRKANERAFREEASTDEEASSTSLSDRATPTSSSFPTKIKKKPVQQQKAKSNLTVQLQKTPPRILTEKERGRSRSPRRTEVLSSKTPPFVSSVRLHRPDSMPSPGSSASSQSSTPGQGALPLWWTTPAASEPSTVAEKIADAPKQDKQEEVVSTHPSQDLEDIAEVSSEGTSPPNQDDQGEPESEDEETMQQVALAPLHISPYGLSHFAVRRPEPEGLSDIAEEGSVLSASITSAGVASRSLSPEGSGARGEMSPQTSLTAASMILSEQEWNERWQRPRWPVEEEEGEEHHEQLANNPMAFSPPTNPQPGPSLPLVYQQGNRRSSDDINAGKQDDSAASSSSAGGSPSSGGTPRKKPKGDVWW